jgi:hypothetical protein
VDKAQELKEQLQQKIVDIITSKLASGEMNQDRAKEIAKHVLDVLPEEVSYQKLMEIIPTLDDHFFELSEAVIPIMVEYEKKVKAIINEKIAALLKMNKFDEALDYTKKAILFEKSLN